MKAIADPEFLGLERGRVDRLDPLRVGLRVEKQDEEPRTVRCGLWQGVVLHDAGDLVQRSDEDPNLEPKPLLDPALDQPFQARGAASPAGEDRVAALDVRSNVLEPERAEQVTQIRHGDLVARSQVDPAEQRNVGRHRAMVPD
jgi:hypothetical protein